MQGHRRVKGKGGRLPGGRRERGGQAGEMGDRAKEGLSRIPAICSPGLPPSPPRTERALSRFRDPAAGLEGQRQPHHLTRLRTAGSHSEDEALRAAAARVPLQRSRPPPPHSSNGYHRGGLGPADAQPQGRGLKVGSPTSSVTQPRVQVPEPPAQVGSWAVTETAGSESRLPASRKRGPSRKPSPQVSFKAIGLKLLVFK